MEIFKSDYEKNKKMQARADDIFALVGGDAC